MASLHLRILLAASIVLVAFFGLTGVILDNAFRHSAEEALQARLQSYAYALVAVMEPDAQGAVQLNNALPIPRFFTPGSGLYGRVIRNDGRSAWRSPSMAGLVIPFPRGLARGERRSQRLRSSGALLASFNIGVSWDEQAPQQAVYTFSVAEDTDNLNAQLGAFRRTLWTSLAGVAMLLLAVQGAILRWGLLPLRRVATDLAAIEQGDKSRLEGHYPSELQGLTDNLNALVNSERQHLQRFRHALDDLAHSLKTPLALMRSAVETHQSLAVLRPLIEEQVARMSRLIEYQLQRGATAGRSVLVAPVAIAPVADKIIQALHKVYHNKQVHCRLQIDPGICFLGDEGDLMEMLGNLFDNAFKWCRQEIVVGARLITASEDAEGGLLITVEDDGPGIPTALRTQMLKRGVRGDQQVPGHGIGLAMIQDMLQVYQGRCEIGQGQLGGARLRLFFPQTPATRL